MKGKMRIGSITSNGSVFTRCWLVFDGKILRATQMANPLTVVLDYSFVI